MRPVNRDDAAGAASCAVQKSGQVELYFYGELDPAERAAVDRHRLICGQCRQALDELAVIRDALAARPVVAGPPTGDWSGFMSRLDAAIGRETAAGGAQSGVDPGGSVPGHRSYVPLLAMAALLALVTMSVLFVARSRSVSPAQDPAARAAAERTPGDTAAGDTGSLSAVSQQHLERSKLVLLGLASKDATRTAGNDWTYERELASRLLADTRLYRMAAEDRGLDTLAGVMRDLELVLLQTSMTEGADPSDLSQIQRAISKRDLLQKMDVVRTSRGT
jgi:hypothetical protein